MVAAPDPLRILHFTSGWLKLPRHAPLSVALCQVDTLFTHTTELYTMVYMVIITSP